MEGGLSRWFGREKSKSGGGAAVWLEIGLGLGFFVVFSFQIPPYLCVLKATIYMQNII